MNLKNKLVSIPYLMLLFFVGMLLLTGCSSQTDTTKDKVNTSPEAAIGDTAVIDFVGYLDGKEFDGGSANNYFIELGSNLFVDDFEQQIVGHKVGDKFDVNVTFPDNYENESLKGKDVVFKVTLHEVWRKIASDID